MKPYPIELANYLSYPRPFILYYLEIAEYLDDWIDFDDGRSKGGILDRLILTYYVLSF